MDELKYDVASLYCAPRGQTFYFIRNNVHGFFESRGMDLSSTVYFLLFKLRDFRKDHRECMQLLKKGDFDFRNKPYYDEDELIQLAKECAADENNLFKKREHEIDLSLLDEEDELGCMAYVAQFNPRRGLKDGYYTPASDQRALIDSLIREVKFDKMVEKMMEVLERDINTINPEQTKLSKLIDIDDLKYMITGINGDVWVDLFLLFDLPEREKYSLLYKAQPFLILENKTHKYDVEYLRYAMDGVKNDQEKLYRLFEALPKKMQKHNEVIDFYNWHS